RPTAAPRVGAGVRTSGRGAHARAGRAGRDRERGGGTGVCPRDAGPRGPASPGGGRLADGRRSRRARRSPRRAGARGCSRGVRAGRARPERNTLFDAAAFAAMKPGAVFCNVARGSLVDEAALLDALQAGHIAAAALDVTRTEPLPADSSLWDAPNLLLSPHSAASLDRYVESVIDLFVDNLGRYLRGESLRNVVELSTGETR